MAPSYIASVVAVLVNLLKLIGIEVGSEALTTTLVTLITIAAGVIVMIRQVVTGRSTPMGVKPK